RPESARSNRYEECSLKCQVPTSRNQIDQNTYRITARGRRNVVYRLIETEGNDGIESCARCTIWIDSCKKVLRLTWPSVGDQPKSAIIGSSSDRTDANL